MADSRTKLLNLIATVLLAITAIVCVSLGRWQLSRAEERKETAEIIKRGRMGASIDLNAVLLPDQLQPWKSATAEGVWQPQFSLLLDNRNLEGKPGLWLATPLLFNDGRAVLVLRGWFARPIGSAVSPEIPTPSGRQNITGELALHVPRLFELWSGQDKSQKGLPLQWPAPHTLAQTKDNDRQPTSDLIRVQNIDLAELSTKLGIKLLPVVLMQKDATQDGLIRVWPEPSVDADKNLGYAMQWFGFAAIAVIAWFGLAWRVWRRKKSG